MKPEPNNNQGPYQLFMLVLCVVVLAVLAIEAVVDIDPETQRLLLVFDTVAALIFLGDFFHSLYKAPRRLHYLRTWGWIDFLSSIPSAGALRWGRAARIARLLRIMRGARSARFLGSLVLRRRSESALFGSVLIGVLTIFFGSVAILQVEGSAGGNIQTAGDALWWTVVTISTTGYGDLFPITGEGRAIATGIMFVGIALFGSVTALFASWLLAPADPQD